MNITVKHVIFDWSGVISNDLHTIFFITSGIFRKLGRKPISIFEFRQTYTLPYMGFWHKYFPELKKELADTLFMELFFLAPQPEIVPGAREVLKKIKRLGKDIAILSSHPQEKLWEEANRYGIMAFITEALGSTYDKRLVISDLMKRNGFQLNATAYVGDMVHDIETAKSAGVISIAVATENIGYQDKEILKKANPDYLFENIIHIMEIFQTQH